MNKEEWEKQQKEDEAYLEFVRLNFGQGLKGKYAIVRYIDDDNTIKWWSAVDWQIVDGFLSCVTLDCTHGLPYDRQIIPTKRVHELIAQEIWSNFEADAKRYWQQERPKVEKQMAQPTKRRQFKTSKTRKGRKVINEHVMKLDDKDGD